MTSTRSPECRRRARYLLSLVAAMLVAGPARASLENCARLLAAPAATPVAGGAAWIAWDAALRSDARARAEKSLEALLGQPAEPFAGLDAVSVDFLKDALLPVVFGRALLRLDAAGRWVSRPWRNDGPGDLVLAEDGEIRLRIQLDVADLERPSVTYGLDETLLRVPRDYGWRHLPPEERAGVVRRFLQGHTMHPYIDSPNARAERAGFFGRALELKEPQLHAVAAATGTYERFLREPSDPGTLLVVGSTALGKTRVAMEFQAFALGRSERKLHVVTTDEVRLVKQLRDGWSAFGHELRGGGPERFVVAQFDREAMRPTPAGVVAVDDLAALEQLVRVSPVPVVLVTGTRQLKEAVGASSGENAPASAAEARIVAMLGTVFFDEAHELGDPSNRVVFRRWKALEGSRFFLLGATATPAKRVTDTAAETPSTELTTGDGIRPQRGPLERLFSDRVFWAGEDVPVEFLSRTTPAVRPVETVLRQMAVDASLGRTIDFFQGSRDAVHVLDLNAAYKLAGGSRAAYWGHIAASLQPLFLAHRKGLVFAGERIAEANAMLGAAQALGIGRRFAVLHSDLSRAEQERVVARFRDLHGENRIDHLVVVDMLGAGFDLPELSLLVDFSRAGNEQEVVQHFGRVMRPAKGKRHIEIVLAQALDDVRVAALLRVYAELERVARAHAPSQRLPPAGMVSLAGPFAPVPLSQVRFWNVQPRVEEVQRWDAGPVRQRASELNAFYRTHRRMPVLSPATVDDDEGRLAIDAQVLAVHKAFVRRVGGDGLGADDAAALRREMEAIRALARPQLELRFLALAERLRLLAERYVAKRKDLDGEVRKKFTHLFPPSEHEIRAVELPSREEVALLADDIEAARRELQMLVRAYAHPDGGVFPAGPPAELLAVWQVYVDAKPKSWSRLHAAYETVYRQKDFVHTMGQLKGSVKEGWGVELKLP